MKLQVNGRQYNGGCSDAASWLAATWLATRLGNYGADLELIEFQPCYRSRSGPGPSLERMYETYHRDLSALPKLTYRRTCKMAEISYACRALTAEVARSDSPLEAKYFSAVLAEMTGALELLRKKLTERDDFNLEAFLSDVQRALREAPSTATELDLLRRSFDEVHASTARRATDLEERRRRMESTKPARPLKGIRIFHGFGRLELAPYDFILKEILSNLLRRNSVRLAGYDEIYVQVEESLEEARRHLARNTWHRYTYAQLDYPRFLQADEAGKWRLLLGSVRQGLHHIADVEGLDREAIDRSLEAFERGGPGLWLTWAEEESAAHHATLTYQVAPFQKPTSFTLRLVQKSTGRTAEGTLFECLYDPDCLAYLLGKMSVSRQRVRLVRRGSLKAKVWLENFKVTGDLETGIEDFFKKHSVATI